MTHRKKGRILSRTVSARKALLRSLATNLVLYEKIKTTLAKAKEMRPVIEKLVTVSKENNLTSRRKLLSVLYNPKAVQKMLEVIGPKFKERPGGYTRIVKLINRSGDGASMARIEFV